MIKSCVDDTKQTESDTSGFVSTSKVVDRN